MWRLLELRESEVSGQFAKIDHARLSSAPSASRLLRDVTLTIEHDINARKNLLERAFDTLPTRSVRRLLSIDTINVAFATESFERPLAPALMSTLPGASAQW